MLLTAILRLPLPYNINNLGCVSIVTDCQPMIEEEDLGRLLGRLKKSLDWHQFIVAVRQRFTALARRDTS